MKRYCLMAATAFTFLGVPALAGDPDLVVLDWAGYDIEGVNAPYKEKYGDAPTYAFFASDDEALQRALSGFKADVIHPCSQMVAK